MSALDPTYADYPWLRLLNPRLAPVGEPPATMLDALRATVARVPDRVALHYFDAAITYRELDQLTDGLAGRLIADRLRPGDRLVVATRNIPHFVIALYGAWKAGAVVVPADPECGEPGIRHLLKDSAATAVVCHEEAWHGYVRTAAGAAGVRLAYTCCPLDFRTRRDPRLLGGTRRMPATDAVDLLSCAREGAERPSLPSAPAPGDTALISYSSGVSGVPRGALTTHGNIAAGVYCRRRTQHVRDGAVVFAMSPLAHTAGLVGELSVAVTEGTPVVLAYRFEPIAAIEAFREYRPARAGGPPAAFMALMAAPGVVPGDFASFEHIDCDGAPLPPTVVDEFHERFGVHLRNGYGMTETTGTITCVPSGLRAPVDPVSGILSVGLPMPETMIRILDGAGHEVPFGEPGEIAVRGPMVAPGYWGRPEADGAAPPGPEVLTGDIGFMDTAGWLYVVDRKQDMINASGFIVRPRDVEDALRQHPAVREAAVVGMPDAGGAETVAAYVSLMPGEDADPDAMAAFVRHRLAAFKCPRSITVLPDLPKTADGKMLRRELRSTAIPPHPEHGTGA